MAGAAVASTAPRPARLRRRPVLAIVLALLLALSFTPEARAAFRAAALLPYVFPDAPARPLDWVTRTPVYEEVRYADGSRTLVADLYRPSDDGRHAALVLSLGVNPAPRDDPGLVRIATGLARDGFVVLIPDSPDLRSHRILPSEREALVAAFRYVAGRAEVDRARIGFVGFSAGASLLTVAAADPRISAEVRLVNFFGGYDDALTLLREMASRRIALDNGRVVPWRPEPLARSIFAGVLLENVDDPSDRAIVSRALRDGETLPPAVLGRVGPRALLVYDLFTADDPARVDALLAALPEDVVDRLRSLSPSANTAGLRARMFLMHDTDDGFVPFVESRRLAARLPQSQRVYTEFSIFAHVEPTRSVDTLAFVGDVAKLLRHLYLVMREFA